MNIDEGTTTFGSNMRVFKNTVKSAEGTMRGKLRQMNARSPPFMEQSGGRFQTRDTFIKMQQEGD